MKEAIRGRAAFRRGFDSLPLGDLLEPSGSSTIADRIAGGIGVDLGADGHPGELAAHPHLRGHTLWVSGTSEPEGGQPPWNHFIEQFAKAASALDPVERPIIITALSAPVTPTEVVADAALAQLDWLGVIGPLDTALVIRETLLADERSIDPVVERTMTEIARFDLDLAERLALEWSGEIADLPDLVPSVGIIDVGWSDAPRPQRLSALGQDERRFWDEGRLELWEGQAQAHVGATGPSTEKVCEHLIWRAQVGVLFGEIEEWRVRLTEWACRMPQLTSVDESYPLRDLEIGPLASSVASRIQMNHPDVAQLLYWLKGARNDLAHVTPLSLDRLLKGRVLMSSCGGVIP